VLISKLLLDNVIVSRWKTNASLVGDKHSTCRILNRMKTWEQMLSNTSISALRRSCIREHEMTRQNVSAQYQSATTDGRIIDLSSEWRRAIENAAQWTLLWNASVCVCVCVCVFANRISTDVYRIALTTVCHLRHLKQQPIGQQARHAAIP